MAEREKTVLTLYYYEGLTLAEIGDILGVTESRVCQIHTKAVLQLRAKLADRPEAAGRRARTGQDQVVGTAPPAGPRAPPVGPRRRAKAPAARRGQGAQTGPDLGHRLSHRRRSAPAEWSVGGPRHYHGGAPSTGGAHERYRSRTRPRPRSPLTRGAVVGKNQPS